MSRFMVWADNFSGPVASVDPPEVGTQWLELQDERLVLLHQPKEMNTLSTARCLSKRTKSLLKFSGRVVSRLMMSLRLESMMFLGVCDIPDVSAHTPYVGVLEMLLDALPVLKLCQLIALSQFFPGTAVTKFHHGFLFG